MTDPRTAVEALRDLIAGDDAEFGPEARDSSEGIYLVRETVTIETGYDCLTIEGEGDTAKVLASMYFGEELASPHELTEGECLAVLVAGGHRVEGGAA